MWTVIFSVLSASACIASLTAVFYAARIATRLRELQRTLKPLPLSRLQLIETSVNEITTELQAVANSLKMQRVRAATTHATAKKIDPDPYTQPDEWRKMMNSRLAQQKMGGSP